MTFVHSLTRGGSRIEGYAFIYGNNDLRALSVTDDDILIAELFGVKIEVNLKPNPIQPKEPRRASQVQIREERRQVYTVSELPLS
jgi:hypothetical protein